MSLYEGLECPFKLRTNHNKRDINWELRSLLQSQFIGPTNFDGTTIIQSG